MNVPESTLAPFGYTGVPVLRNPLREQIVALLADIDELASEIAPHIKWFDSLALESIFYERVMKHAIMRQVKVFPSVVDDTVEILMLFKTYGISASPGISEWRKHSVTIKLP